MTIFAMKASVFILIINAMFHSCYRRTLIYGSNLKDIGVKKTSLGSYSVGISSSGSRLPEPTVLFRNLYALVWGQVTVVVTKQTNRICSSEIIYFAFFYFSIALTWVIIQNISLLASPAFILEFLRVQTIFNSVCKACLVCIIKVIKWVAFKTFIFSKSISQTAFDWRMLNTT